MQQELVSTLRAHRARFVQLGALAIAQSNRTAGGAGLFNDKVVENLVGGLLTSIEEALEGGVKEKRALVLETAIPALVESGRDYATTARSLTALGVMLSHEVASELAPDLRGEAITWLAACIGEIVGDVVRAGRRAARDLGKNFD